MANKQKVPQTTEHFIDKTCCAVWTTMIIHKSDNPTEWVTPF